jgi:acyl transferase domain-containing protein
MDFEKSTDEDLAIIGMVVRLPGSDNVAEFWQSLLDRRCALTVDDARTVAERDARWVYSSGRLGRVDRFDAEFFRIPSAEAEAMDPQQRLFLESCYHALEAAGHARPEKRPRTGVFASSAYVTYGGPASAQPADPLGLFKQMLARDKDFLATRVSYLLDLNGPALNVQTACSSSLVAVHYACQSLLAGECDLALAGGVSLALPEYERYRYVPDMIFSIDGHCRPFDHRSSGTVLANGLGVVVLARLEDALEREDEVIAVIKGSAVGNDGRRKASFTSPSRVGQAEVLEQALRVARTSVDDVGYIEAHGTATKVGDAIELGALTDVYQARAQASGRIAIGSAKANVGHLNTAAGVVGLIKAALMVRHRTLVGMPGYEQPNPLLEIEKTPFEVCRDTSAWGQGSAPLVAGVSSFGIGGTNAHVLLASPPPIRREEDAPDDEHQLYVVSGKTRASHQANLRAHAAYFLGRAGVTLAGAASAALSRELFGFRTAVVARGADELGARLLAAAEATPRSTDTGDARTVVFVCSDENGPSPRDCRSLSAASPAYRVPFDECSSAVREACGVDVSWPGQRAFADGAMESTGFGRLLLFCHQYALHRFWAQLGLNPSTLVGRGRGEVIALACAGAVPLERAARALHLDALDTRGREALAMAERVSHCRVILDRRAVEDAGAQRPLVTSVLEAAALRIDLAAGALTRAASGAHDTTGAGSSARAAVEPWPGLLQAVADVVNAGWDLDVTLLRPGRLHAMPGLPLYAFERARYWAGDDATQTPPKADGAGGADAVVSSGARVAIRTTLETILREVCGDAYARARADESWADLGIESLAAVDVVERIRRALGVEFDIFRFYECQTLDRLCAYLEAELDAGRLPARAGQRTAEHDWHERTL